MPFACTRMSANRNEANSAPAASDWVELHNRGESAISLAGWRLDGGIDFRFGTNDGIAAGGYLVAAKDPAALRAKFPGITVVGPYANKLSRSGVQIVLRDAADNPEQKHRRE